MPLLSYKTIVPVLLDKSTDDILISMINTVRKTKRPATISFYLGDKPVREERIAAIDAIAGKYGMTRSQMLQAIADGELVLSKPR